MLYWGATGVSRVADPGSPTGRMTRRRNQRRIGRSLTVSKATAPQPSADTYASRPDGFGPASRATVLGYASLSQSRTLPRLPRHRGAPRRRGFRITDPRHKQRWLKMVSNPNLRLRRSGFILCSGGRISTCDLPDLRRLPSLPLRTFIDGTWKLTLEPACREGVSLQPPLTTLIAFGEMHSHLRRRTPSGGMCVGSSRRRRLRFDGLRWRLRDVNVARLKSQPSPSKPQPDRGAPTDPAAIRTTRLGVTNGRVTHRSDVATD